METPLPGLFANFYVIGVDGVPLLSLSPDNGRLATVPRSGGKPPWTVKASVLRKPIRDSSVNIFAFARAAAPIGPDKEDATFAPQFEPWHIEAKCRPKDMLYHGLRRARGEQPLLFEPAQPALVLLVESAESGPVVAENE